MNIVYNSAYIYIMDSYYTNLRKRSLNLSALNLRLNMFPSTGRAVKRGPGGMFLKS